MEVEIRERAKFRGVFTLECYRKGKLIWTDRCSNLLTNEGLDHMLDVTLHGKTLISPFYVVLSETNTTPLATHDYAVPGYTETTAYDEATRPEYEEAAASSQSITNTANKATFTIDATKTIYGGALVGGSSTKSDVTDAATHVLLCSALLGTARAVLDDDVINVTYAVSAADDGV